MQEENRQGQIHSKGFDMLRGKTLDYSKIKIGTKKIEDPIFNIKLATSTAPHAVFYNKQRIYKALAENDLSFLRQLSNYFYKTSGIYARMCEYVANMYRYDWYVVPEIFDSSYSQEKILTKFNEVLDYLDNSYIRETCGRARLSVVRDGAYYAYVINTKNGAFLQELPVKYCRTRFYLGAQMPIIEFNMRFFDDTFLDINYRMKIIKTFPEDIQKGYILFKQGKLPVDHYGDTCGGSWYTLEPGAAIKFSLNDSDIPVFVNAIPSIIDLRNAQGLDRQKQLQQLQKLIIQTLPLDKNGDLIFDLDEATDIHNNAVEMVGNEVGVDVLTTFAKIDVEDIADTSQNTATDGLERMERTVYNNLGTSRNIFNSNSNLALEKSILDDESTFRKLLLQFANFYSFLTKNKGGNAKKYVFRFYMLETTQYNYKELSKMYKDQVQIGYSKILPQIALGQSQSAILHTAYFENKVLNLSEIMIPPLMSSTLSASEILGNKNQSANGNSQKSSDGNVGRPEKSDDEKSEKTIANKESM